MLLSHDLRVAVRALSRRPGFALTALLTVAIAIGGNTAIFSVVRGVLLASLPWRAPDELVTIDARANNGYAVSTSALNYRDWTERARVFRSTGASVGWIVTIVGNGLATVFNV